MIAFVVGVLVIWLMLAAFRRIEATVIGGLLCAVALIIAFGWPVLIGGAAVAAYLLWQYPRTT
jgi:hypothetical protein